MAIHKKVLYGSVRHIEYFDSVNFPGKTTCLVTLNVFDAQAGGLSTVRVYHRGRDRFEKRYPLGSRVGLKCDVEYPRPGLRRYIYYG
jgi:hypothetical protein